MAGSVNRSVKCPRIGAETHNSEKSEQVKPFRFLNHVSLRLLAGLGAAVLLVGVPAASSAAGSTRAASTPGQASATTFIRVSLTPQPIGTVTLAVGAAGRVVAALDVTGIAPGTAHAIDIQAEGCNVAGAATIKFPLVTASSTGQLEVTVRSLQPLSGTVPSSGSFVVHLGPSLTSPVAGLPIACADLASLSAHHATLQFQALSDQIGPLRGSATFLYRPSTQTLTVHVQASGLAPFSQHANHIHAGSCAAQGPVLYMLPDLIANAAGEVNEVAMFTGVTSPPPASGWYFNLHLGNSNQIATPSGVPTILFRPLLCGDLVGN